jgi:hypothetical protein
MLLKKSILKRMQLAVLFESFDCSYRAAICLHSESSTRLDGPAVDHDCARPAVTRIAADVSSSKPQSLTEKMDQEQSGFDFSSVFDAVDIHGDRNFSHG